jgi:hypothetical protein
MGSPFLTHINLAFAARAAMKSLALLNNTP